MNCRQILGAVPISLAIAACSGGTPDGNADNAVAPANVAAPSEPANAAAPVAPAASSSTFGPDFMVGKWSAIDEDCSATLDFSKAGTVTTPIGTAKWSIAGDKLTIDHGDGSEPTTSTVKVLSPDRIELTHKSGTKETERRC